MSQTARLGPWGPDEPESGATGTGGIPHVRDSSGAAPHAGGGGGSPPPGRDVREQIAATHGQEVTGAGMAEEAPEAQRRRS